MRVFLLAILSLFFLQSSSTSGYKIGDKISDFTLTNIMDNNRVSLSDFAHQKAIAVIFSDPDCPYFKIYEPRILELANDFENQHVAFLFVVTKLENRNSFVNSAREKGYKAPVLIDATRSLVKTFSATRAPEVFVLKNMQGNLILQYKGAIDDSPQDSRDIKNFYFKDALQAIVSDGPIKIAEKRPTGCVLK
jgi:thioredoxin-related protein